MMVSKALLIGLLALPSGISGSNIGVVGLGRTLFEPICCYGCLSSFWGLSLSCTQAHSGEGNYGSSPSCHATSTVYLNSLAYCMQTKCRADNVSSSVVEECWRKVAGDGIQVSSLENNIPTIIPTTQLAYSANSLDKVSLVNDQYYLDSRATIKGSVAQESAHAKYGMIVVVVVAGFCVVLGLHRLKSHYLPFLSLPKVISNPISKYITSPALIGNRHLERLPGNLGYIPSRSLSLLIICYVALNAALCGINYPTQVPDTWFISTSKQRISWISNRLGVLCFANIALTIMFSGRNTPLSWITGADRSDILTFHRWASRVAVVQAIGHVVLYWTNTSESGNGMFTLAANIHVVNFDSSYWAFGIGAVAAMGFLVVVFSILPMRIKFYETFLFLHILLAMGTLIGLWYHVVLRFNKAYGYEIWLYIAFAFWGFDRLARPIRIVVLNWKSWLLKDYPSATVELLPGDEFVKVTVFPSLTWYFTAGQHCYLYFPSLGLNPFQSHPFSIASWSSNRQLRNGEPIFVASPSYEQQIMELRTLSPSQHRQDQDHPTLTHHSRPAISFIMRPEQGLTRSLYTRLLRNSRDRISESIPVCLEGPYGTGPPVSLANADTILAIAGGIGITSIISYLQLYLETLRNPNHASEPRRGGGARASRFVLVWSAREESLVKAIRSQIGDVVELGRKGVEIRIVDTRTAGRERLDVPAVVQGEVLGEENEGRKVTVVVCGPGGMADAVRGAVVGCIGKGDVEVELVEESFCW